MLQHTVITVYRPVRIMISPRLTDFWFLPKYESNPRHCFELYHNSLGYRMPSENCKRNATKSKLQQRIVKCETRDQRNCEMKLEKKEKWRKNGSNIDSSK